MQGYCQQFVDFVQQQCAWSRHTICGRIFGGREVRSLCWSMHFVHQIWLCKFFFSLRRGLCGLVFIEVCRCAMAVLNILTDLRYIDFFHDEFIYFIDLVYCFIPEFVIFHVLSFQLPKPCKHTFLKFTSFSSPIYRTKMLILISS